ncbi:hypothetical protein BS78_06G195900 [Paspalum vaginatum]|nr:hypothetical protein BS78_06G195900 [Paspalum vaginatum]
MNRGGSSGGGRSSLGYLFEPETTLYRRTARPNQEAEKTTPDTNGTCVEDGKKTSGAEADQEPLHHHHHLKREVSNPILSSHRPPSNIYRTSQLSQNSGFLISDRPSTRVRCAPGGPSSLGFLFGEEHEK